MTWTLAKDALPELDTPVWAAHRVGDHVYHSILSRVDIGYVENDHTEWVWYHSHYMPACIDGKWEDDGAEHDDDYDVIAWQHLPVPYTQEVAVKT